MFTTRGREREREPKMRCFPSSNLRSVGVAKARSQGAHWPQDDVGGSHLTCRPQSRLGTPSPRGASCLTSYGGFNSRGLGEVGGWVRASSLLLAHLTARPRPAPLTEEPDSLLSRPLPLGLSVVTAAQRPMDGSGFDSSFHVPTTQTGLPFRTRGQVMHPLWAPTVPL